MEDDIARARDLFQHRYKRSFTFEHWYYLLKDQSKRKVIPISRGVSTSSESEKRIRLNEVGEYCDMSTPSTIAAIDCPEQTSAEDESGSSHPTGRKTRKKKMKEKAVKMELVKTAADKLDVLQKQYEHQVETHKEWLRLKEDEATLKKGNFEKKMLLEQSKIDLEVRRHDDYIMALDISTMTLSDAEYFYAMKEEIRQKRGLPSRPFPPSNWKGLV